MDISYLRNSKFTRLSILSLYLIFLFISLFVYDDFGISADEWVLRYEGLKNIKYISEIFFSNAVNEIDKIIARLDVLEYTSDDESRYYGSIFSIGMAFIEFFFNIDDSKDYYLLRHYFNHIIFLISNFYFFLLVKDRFNNIYWGILGALFLYLSPRIFAHSFYNYKDLLFLSLSIINLYYALKFLEKPNIIILIFFSLFTALSVDTRIMGIFLPFVIILFSYINYLRKSDNKIIIYLIYYIILTPFLIIFFWPFLWENPFTNFISGFKAFSNFFWDGMSLYFGKYIPPSNLDWHYTFVWIGITTPIFYLILFFVGLITIILRLKNRLLRITNNNSLNDLWRGEKELKDLIFFICFIFPIFIVILFNSQLYDGWRQLYFIYPCILMISLKGLYLIKIKYFKEKIFAFITLILIFLGQISINMIKIHPHQNVYFNFIAGKNIEKKFEMDYWGLSNKQAFEYILRNDKQNKIFIAPASTNHLENSKKILNKNDRNRIRITGSNKALYIIDNYRNWYGAPKKEFLIPDNFKIIKEIYNGKQKIISIYKRI